MFKPVSPKVDFPKLEREILKKWYEKGIVEKYIKKNSSSKEKFSFLDGPITANNPMGVHHAWGRTYKDFWQKYWNMKGKRQRFQNGFDEQGLWVEVEVEKELGLKNKKDIENLVKGDKFKSLEKFINLCKERVRKYSKIQTEQSKRLGYFMDWANSYHTSSSENNYAIWNFLKIVHEKGWLYKGRDSVPWCPRCGTAISQHEILTEEYLDITHRAVFVKYRILNTNDNLLVWTTTPWTLPSNVAIAINPEFNYWRFTNRGGENVIIVDPEFAKESGNELVRRLGLLAPEWEVRRGKENPFKGSELIGKKYRGPFDELPAVQSALKENFKTFHTIVAEKDLVTAKEGTGLVHIAPGAGEEDFDLAQVENLPVIDSIDESANYIQGFGNFSGKNAKENPRLVISELEKRGALFKTEDYIHRYPVCWRCKTELVWRVVDEWYIRMGTLEEKNSLRNQMIKVAKKIHWIPEWGRERELDWLKNMDDWLISKKRYWGLALPIWECKKCKRFEVIGGEEELKEKAISGWDEFKGNSPHRPWIDLVKIKCSECGEELSRIPDVGNPWLDAGIVPFSTMPEDWFPADFITESFPGQFKNWFYVLIAMSTVLKGENPFSRVLGFGSVKDEKGEEMHKSKGNAIEFNEAADKIGVDVMRWLYLRTNPEHNVNFGFHVASEIRRFFHLRLWNVYTFFAIYASADNWRPSSEKFDPQNVLDRWILSRVYGNIKNLTNSVEKYNSHEASGHAEIFVINDLSTWYVRRIRDRVGPSAQDEKSKSDAYQTLWTVLKEYSKALAPFVPFIADEIYTNLTGEETVHLTDWPLFNESLINKELEKEMELVRQIVEFAHAKRKEARIKVRQPLSKLRIKNLELRINDKLVNLVKDEVNVKQIELLGGKGILSVELDTKITPQLKKEGEAREIVRMIQGQRKKMGAKLDERVNVILPDWPIDFEEYIKKRALINSIKKGDKLEIQKL